MTFIEPREFKHHDHDEMAAFMRDYSTQYPDITRLYEIGESVQGKKLWVMEISDNPGVHEPGRLTVLALYAQVESSFWFDTKNWDGPLYISRGHRL